jgi:hypothetical protein
VSRARFWGTVLGVALLYTLLTALLLPFDRLGAATEALRWRTWLLTLWTGGVLCVLFGLAGLLGYRLPPGFREVAEAGSLRAAMRARAAARERGEGGNFAVWLMALGVVLVGVYFVVWAVVER